MCVCVCARSRVCTCVRNILYTYEFTEHILFLLSLQYSRLQWEGHLFGSYSSNDWIVTLSVVSVGADVVGSVLAIVGTVGCSDEAAVVVV